MASFVNLMDDVVWTETDIINRTESMIRKEFSVDEENILTRKTSAAMMGQYALSFDESEEIQRYAAACAIAQYSGKLAREDMAFLQQALNYEAAQRLLERGWTYTPQQVADARALVTQMQADHMLMGLVGERERFKALNS
jgi:hypothetical protein